MEDTLEQIQKDISTGVSGFSGIQKIMGRIVAQIQKSKLNQADNTLQIENDALKKNVASLNNIINYQNSELQAFSNILKLSDDLTIPQKVIKAGELMAELEILRAKK